MAFQECFSQDRSPTITPAIRWTARVLVTLLYGAVFGGTYLLSTLLF
jgi:hypothetical protein